MTITFSIEKSRQTLLEQWSYIAQRGRDNSHNNLKKCITLLAAISMIYASFYFFTQINDYIVLKVITGILIVLLWLATPICFLIYLIEKRKSKGRVERVVELFTEEDLKYSARIDAERLVLSYSSRTVELSWTDYDTFGVHGDTIFLFNTALGVNSLFFSQNEIGINSWSELLTLIQQRSIKQAF